MAKYLVASKMNVSEYAGEGIVVGWRERRRMVRLMSCHIMSCHVLPCHKKRERKGRGSEEGTYQPLFRADTAPAVKLLTVRSK
jgi:hypothetical protein